MTPSTYYSSAVAVAVGTVLFLVLGIGALGIIGDGGRPDMLYAAALAVGVAGALIARFTRRRWWSSGLRQLLLGAAAAAATYAVGRLIGVGAAV